MMTIVKNGSKSAPVSSSLTRVCHEAMQKKTRKELWTQPAAVRLSLIGRTIYPAYLQSKAPHTRRRQIMGTRVIRLRDVIRAPAMVMYLPPKSRMR